MRDNVISVNGRSVFEDGSEDYGTFIKAAYRNLDIEHPKFFKMDALSKLAFIAAEPLLREETEKNMALVFANRASSLNTDRRHQRAIADPSDYYPSPAVFVYTLPNICLGEISIRHRLYTENAFFVAERFSGDLLFDYTNALLDGYTADKVLCGWVDLDGGKYDAFLYVVGNSGIFAHSTTEIQRLYKTNERFKT